MMADKARITPVTWNRARKKEKKLRQRIERALAGNMTDEAAQRTRRYLQSHPAKWVAVVRANIKLRKADRLNRREVRELAETLNPWSGTDEVVRAGWKRKESGGYRVVQKFGIHNRALQYLLRGVLEPWADRRCHPSQFALRGGRHEACSAVMAALDAGNVWACQIDIKDCYESFDREGVSSLLPTPKVVTNHVVVACHYNTLPYTQAETVKDAKLIARARRGVAQGSAVSDLVAEMLLAPVLGLVSEDSTPVNYADNFVVLSDHKSRLSADIYALCCSLKEHPAGPLRPKNEGVIHASAGFDFLGYTFTLKDGVASARPSNHNLAIAKRRLKEFQCRFEAAEEDLDRLDHEASEFVRSWSGAFKLWKGAEWWRTENLNEIDEWATWARADEISVSQAS